METNECLYEAESDEILLDRKSTSGKQAHFLEETVWIPARHRVIRRIRGTRKRLWGLLPSKTIEPEPETLELPEEITAEKQVLAYVKKHKRSWLRRR